MDFKHRWSLVTVFYKVHHSEWKWFIFPFSIQVTLGTRIPLFLIQLVVFHMMTCKLWNLFELKFIFLLTCKLWNLFWIQHHIFWYVIFYINIYILFYFYFFPVFNSVYASPVEDDFAHCETKVFKWASSALDFEVREDKRTLRDLLFFLHVPRTGGRTYFHW